MKKSAVGVRKALKSVGSDIPKAVMSLHKCKRMQMHAIAYKRMHLQVIVIITVIVTVTVILIVIVTVILSRQVCRKVKIHTQIKKHTVYSAMFISLRRNTAC